MINLLSMTYQRATKYISAAEYHNHCGLLTSPDAGYDVSDSHLWASDNGCFNRYEPDKIIAMLNKYQPYANTCKFIVAPDRVQNAIKTTQLFYMWFHVIKRYGYPVAYVLQDGIRVETVPFDLADVLFIGGSDPFKYSQIVRDIVKIANQRGLWIHNGRVSSKSRLTYMKSIGCDSVDGTHYNIYDPQDIKKHLPYFTNRQLGLGLRS